MSEPFKLCFGGIDVFKSVKAFDKRYSGQCSRCDKRRLRDVLCQLSSCGFKGRAHRFCFSRRSFPKFIDPLFKPFSINFGIKY